MLKKVADKLRRPDFRGGIPDRLMAEETPNLIEFHFAPGQDYPPPFPAVKAIPEWLKMMPADVPKANEGSSITGTAKKCAPFMEAMTCGYVLPVACDVSFFMRAPGNLDYDQAEPVIGSHSRWQYSGSPFADQLLVKFANPWIVKTPPGYSTLFVPLLNQFTIPFQILAGLVETDTFYRSVHFPSICTMQPGQRFVLKKGTPIVQAIPIKRESWQSNILLGDLPKAEAGFAAQNANPHIYKDQYWVKKDFR
jgi:hypothetical protein